MYTLTVKTAEGKTALIGNQECIYDYHSFDDLVKHLEELEASNIMKRYRWKLEVSFCDDEE